MHVQSVWDYWSYDPFDNTSTIDNITVASTDTGIGRWHRMDIADQKWIQQTAWFVDPVGGNDENDGATALTALKTHAEYNRRVGGPDRTLDTGASNIVVTLVGIVPDVFAKVTSSGPTVTYTTALPAPANDTVAAVTNADAATQTYFTVTLTGVWGGQRLVHDTTNDTWFWGYDDVASAAQCTPPNSAPPLFALAAEPSLADALDLFDPADFAVLPSFSFEGVSTGTLPAPAIVLTFLNLQSGPTVGTCSVDRCALGAGYYPAGLGGTVFTSACLFATVTNFGWTSTDILIGGCFLDELDLTDGFAFVIGASNFLHISMRGFDLIADEIRMVDSATRPEPAVLTAVEQSSVLTQSGLWSGPSAGNTLDVEFGAQVVCFGAGGTASMNVSTLAIGTTAPNASPALIPGFVVPALSPCATPAQLYAAPFLNGGVSIAVDYATMARIYVPVTDPGDFRITDADEYRITDAGDFRIID